MNQLADLWRRMGFHVVGPAELEAVDDEGDLQPIGQQSAHVMFADHYLELTSVTHPKPGHHLERFFDAPKGLRLILLNSSDIEKDQAFCADTGLNPGDVHNAARKLEYGECGTARFRWFGLPDAQFPDALVCFVEHLTPERVFDSAQCQHANTASRLTRLGWVGDRIPENYQRLEGTAGNRESTQVETLPPSEMGRLLKTPRTDLSPWAVLGINVHDPDSLKRLLEENGVPFETHGSRTVVQPDATGGLLLVFESLVGSC